MPWEQFTSTAARTVSCANGTSHEFDNHSVLISGTGDNPKMECLTMGCTVVYSSLKYTASPTEKLTGTVTSNAGTNSFKVTYDATGKKITCVIPNPDSEAGGPVTGSWTANDPGNSGGGHRHEHEHEPAHAR